MNIFKFEGRFELEEVEGWASHQRKTYDGPGKHGLLILEHDYENPAGKASHWSRNLAYELENLGLSGSHVRITIEVMDT